MIFNLYRNKEKKIFSGLCAGIADLTGINVYLIRFIWFISTFFSFSFSFWLYVLLSIIIPAKKEIKIPKDLPKDLRKDLTSLKDKLTLIQKNCNREIFNTSLLAFEKLIDFVSLIYSTKKSNDYSYTQRSLINKFNNLIETQILMKKDNIFLDLLNELVTKSNYILNDAYNLKINKLNNKEKIFEWTQSIYPLKVDLLLKTNEQINNLFIEIENKILYLLQYIDSSNLSVDINYNIKKIAYNYLPETIQNYLRLHESALNNKEHLKKAEAQLIEQLNSIDSALNELQNAIYQINLNNMKLHGQFLKEKFN